MFTNRTDAGRLLAMQMRKYRGVSGVVLAIPRGGIPVACEVAGMLQLPLDLLFVKKIGHPLNKELAIGAAGLEGAIIESGIDVSSYYIQEEVLAIRGRLKQMRSRLMGERKPLSLENKTVFIIDDGIATGHTIQSAVLLVQQQHPSRIVVATPVASSSALEKLRPLVSEVVTVLAPVHFGSVGSFYHDFTQVSDEEVAAALSQSERKVEG